MRVNGLTWAVRTRGTGRPLLLIHGFTGSGASWGRHVATFAAAFRTIVVDLPGHGRSGSAEPWRLTVDQTAADLAAILRRLDASPASVLGYSLGARIALILALDHPEAVERLILESPSPGLATAEERIARREADEVLARQLESDGIEAFVEAWERQPMFASHRALSRARRARLRRIRLAQRPEGLAASLRGAGQGVMPLLLDRLPEIAVPTLVIAGSLDERGRPRAEAVAKAIAAARLCVVDGAGHTPHEERPTEFLCHVHDFLQEADAA